MQTLIKLLENRFRNMAYGDEKAIILELLSLYYPIAQNELKKTSEIRESKMNFYYLDTDCMHHVLVKVTNSTNLFK